MIHQTAPEGDQSVEARLGQWQAYPTGQGQDERAMGQRKEALRAAIKDGPRAVLTGWGGEAVPEPGENTGWEWRRLVSLLRELMRSGASGRWRRVSSPLATRQAENSSKNARDSLLTLQPIGRRHSRVYRRIYSLSK